MRVLIIVLFFLSSQAPAQNSIEIRQWLLNKQADIESAFELSILDKSFRPAWIENLELRSQTDEFSLERQEYLIRISPSNPGIRKHQKAFIELKSQEANLYREEVRAELIKIVLEDFVELYELHQKQLLQNTQKNLLEDQELIAQKMLHDPDVNLKKLLEVQEDLSKFHIQQYQDSLRLHQLAAGLPLPDFQELLSIPKIQIQISQLVNQPKELAQDTEYQIDQALIDAEIGIEKAEKNRIIDFVQFRYRGPHDNIFNERLSISLGLELPFSGSSKTKLEELQIEKWKLEQETRNKLALRNRELSKDAAQLDQLISTWTFARKLLEQHEVEYQQLVAKRTEFDWKSPELLLYKKSSNLKRKQDLLDLETTIYSRYLELLQNAGLCFDDSYISYLLQ